MMFLPPGTFRHSWLFLPLIVSTFFAACSVGPSGNSANPHTILQSDDAIDINTADKVELQRLPGVGPQTAEKIILYRRDFGDFKRPSEIILVDGFGEKQYLKIRRLIKTE